ncbi:MAG: ATP-binding protein [Bacteroidota bacterium]
MKFDIRALITSPLKFSVFVSAVSALGTGVLFMLLIGDLSRLPFAILISIILTPPLCYFFARAMNNMRSRVEEELIKLQEKYDETEAARGAMERITEARSKFLSNMSHEIRNGLNSVIGMTNILLEDNPRPEQLEHISVMKFSSDNLMVLVNDILDFGKIEEDKVRIESVDLQLRELVRLVREGLRTRCVDNNVNFRVIIDERVPKFVMGDPTRISQVLNNLLSNAVKFTKNGDVTLKIGWKKENAGEVWLQFAVIDTGIGIPDDRLDAVFEAYTQAKDTTSRYFGGSGLGLPICQKLVTLMGGEILVESEEGIGSTFSFELEFKKSLIRRLDKGIHTEVDITNNDLHGVKVLLVEDNKLNQLVAKKFLKKWGARTDLAENGIEALDAVKSKVFDIILMDLNMPVMSGVEATQQIRSLPGPYFQNIPIIALTASAMLEERDKIMSVGMNDYLAKPFDPTELHRAISKQVFMRRHAS